MNRVLVSATLFLRDGSMLCCARTGVAHSASSRHGPRELEFSHRVWAYRMDSSGIRQIGRGFCRSLNFLSTAEPLPLRESRRSAAMALLSRSSQLPVSLYGVPRRGLAGRGSRVSVPANGNSRLQGEESMTMDSATSWGDVISSITGLPHWETIPADMSSAVKQIKAALRKRIRDHGRTVEEVLDEIKAFLLAEIDDIKATKARGEDVWPVIDFTDIAHGTVSASSLANLHRRGCVVIRGHFSRAQAEHWDAAAAAYVDSNHFFQTYSGPADDFFASLETSKPEIYPIYWSSAQMQARQHPRMATAQQFLNSQWSHINDPNQHILYPDRIRRRPPGSNSTGLGTHLDPGTFDLWMTENYQQFFRGLFCGDFASYDPWDASYRADAKPYPGSTMCSAFRTFQGWTALSAMASEHGALHTVPIPKAMAYLMLRPLASDVAEDDMCGVSLNRAFPVSKQWHELLLDDALCAIPSVQPGDSVWWHCDMIHSVAPVQNQPGWANVMYIPGAPWCPKNAQYAEQVYKAFVAGHSPPDFPPENYEAKWPNRFREQDLNDLGRRSLGLSPLPSST